MKFSRNFVNIFENVEKSLNFLAKCTEFWQNFDRTLMWKVRMVRSLADRTFQLRFSLGEVEHSLPSSFGLRLLFGLTSKEGIERMNWISDNLFGFGNFREHLQDLVLISANLYIFIFSKHSRTSDKCYYYLYTIFSSKVSFSTSDANFHRNSA